MGKREQWKSSSGSCCGGCLPGLGAERSLEAATGLNTAQLTLPLPGLQLPCAWLLLWKELHICNSWHSGKVLCVENSTVCMHFSVRLKGNGDWAHVSQEHNGWGLTTHIGKGPWEKYWKQNKTCVFYNTYFIEKTYLMYLSTGIKNPTFFYLLPGLFYWKYRTSES